MATTHASSAFLAPSLPHPQRPQRLHNACPRPLRSAGAPLRRTRACARPPSPEDGAKKTAVSDAPDTESAAARRDLMKEQLYAFYGEGDTKYQARLANIGRLGSRNFALELRELLRELRRLVGRYIPAAFVPPSCLGFELSNAAIAERERAREARDGAPDAWPAVRFVYSTVCVFLDLLYADRPIERFWVLETVARLPYQAYSSCLHLLSTLGWFHSPTLMNMHHAEDLNEAYHLAVMESLGGDQRWLDRFTAFHASLVYFWILVLLFFISPKQSYAFSQLLESHAVDTYSEFVCTNAEVLKSLPVPAVAHVYFNEFLFYYYEFQTSEEGAPRNGASRGRPQLNSLFDVFQNILADEKEHSTAMEACCAYVETGEPVKYNGREVSGKSRRIKLDADRRKEFWRKWEELRDRERHSQNL